MSDRLLKESDVLRIAFQLPLVVNSAFADAVKALPSADRPQDDEFKNFDRESLILLIEAQKERIGELLADRPQGEWKSVKASIYPYGYDVECSVCGFRMGSSFGYKYCPNCGAHMKGADDE